MAETQQMGGYGFADDAAAPVSSLKFGLNAGNTFLKKFDWINNGGKDGAEQEALDIVFVINGTEKNYRLFPVVKAFGKGNVEITDPNAPEFKDAVLELSAKVCHILHAFLPLAQVKAGLSKPIKSFKEFCMAAKALFPFKNATSYLEYPLDIFMQYGWTLKEGQPRTYLEIPTKMKHGAWLCKATPNAKWVAVTVENPEDNEAKALKYVNENDNNAEHNFTRTGWFMNSNFAKVQKSDGTAVAANTTGAEEVADAPAATEQAATEEVANNTPAAW